MTAGEQDTPAASAQIGAGLLDAVARLFDRLHRRRGRKPEIGRKPIGRAMDRGDPTLVEEIEDEVEIATDLLPFRSDLADRTRAARIEIERTVRHEAAQVRHA